MQAQTFPKPGKSREFQVSKELRTQINIATHAWAKVEAHRLRTVLIDRVKAAANAGATPQDLEALVLDAVQ